MGRDWAERARLVRQRRSLHGSGGELEERVFETDLLGVEAGDAAA
jgi:hypothetical protein